MKRERDQLFIYMWGGCHGGPRVGPVDPWPLGTHWAPWGTHGRALGDPWAPQKGNPWGPWALGIKQVTPCLLFPNMKAGQNGHPHIHRNIHLFNKHLLTQQTFMYSTNIYLRNKHSLTHLNIHLHIEHLLTQQTFTYTTNIYSLNKHLHNKHSLTQQTYTYTTNVHLQNKHSLTQLTFA